MDNADETIDDLRRKLKKSKADSVGLSDYISRVINDNDRKTKMSDNKIERLETNVKLLDGQLELAVNEKFKAEQKLQAVEVQRDDFQRELDKLKRRHEKQETKLQLLRREIESMNEQKKDILTKFKLMKNQETVHDAVVGALKKQFEEKMSDFLTQDASENDVVIVEPIVVSQQAASITDSRFARSSSNEQVNGDADTPNGTESVEPHSMESISDRNGCQTVESVMRGRTQVVLQQMSMRKITGTIIKRSISSSTSTLSRVIRTQTKKTQNHVEIKQPSTMVTERSTSEAVVQRRPRRALRCSLCSKPFVSKPTQAFCRCQQENCY